MNRKPKTSQKDEEEEAVDSMLRAAEDEMLLNLSLNSHTSRGTSHNPNSYIHPDLDRRFETLKAKSSRRLPPLPTSATTPPSPPASDDASDLLARFAALKGDSPFPSSSSCFHESKSNCLQPDRDKMASGDDEVDEDEVQKLIQWAIDAARLDPSPPTDDDDDGDDDDDDDSSNDDDDSDEGLSDRGGSSSKDNRKKGGRKKGIKVARRLGASRAAGRPRSSN